MAQQNNNGNNLNEEQGYPRSNQQHPQQHQVSGVVGLDLGQLGVGVGVLGGMAQAQSIPQQQPMSAMMSNLYPMHQIPMTASHVSQQQPQNTVASTAIVTMQPQTYVAVGARDDSAHRSIYESTATLSIPQHRSMNQTQAASLQRQFNELNRFNSRQMANERGNAVNMVLTAISQSTAQLQATQAQLRSMTPQLTFLQMLTQSNQNTQQIETQYRAVRSSYVQHYMQYLLYLQQIQQLQTYLQQQQLQQQQKVAVQYVYAPGGNTNENGTNVDRNSHSPQNNNHNPQNNKNYNTNAKAKAQPMEPGPMPPFSPNGQQALQIPRHQPTRNEMEMNPPRKNNDSTVRRNMVHDDSDHTAPADRCGICARRHGKKGIIVCAETESCPGALHDECLNRLFLQRSVVHINCPVCDSPWVLNSKRKSDTRVEPSDEMKRKSDIRVEPSDEMNQMHQQRPQQRQSYDRDQSALCDNQPRAVVIHPQQPGLHSNIIFRNMYPHQQRAYVMMKNNNVPQVTMNDNAIPWISHFEDLYWKLGNISMAALCNHDEYDIPGLNNELSVSRNEHNHDYANTRCFRDMVHINNSKEKKSVLYDLSTSKYYKNNDDPVAEIEAMMNHETTAVWYYFKSFEKKFSSCTLLGIKACIVIRKMIFHLNYVSYNQLGDFADICDAILRQWETQSSCRNRKKCHNLMKALVEWSSNYQNAMNTLDQIVMKDPSNCKLEEMQTSRKQLMDVFKSMLNLYLKVANEVTSLTVPALAQIGLFTNTEFRSKTDLYHTDVIFGGMEMHEDVDQTRYLIEASQRIYSENQPNEIKQKNSNNRRPDASFNGTKHRTQHKAAQITEIQPKNSSAKQTTESKDFEDIEDSDDNKIEHCDARDYLDSKRRKQPPMVGNNTKSISKSDKIAPKQRKRNKRNRRRRRRGGK